MKEYLKWDEKIITDFSDENINNLYDKGYVFTRQEKGAMQQTRSVRIDLSRFELNSENRRILRKTEDIQMGIMPIPFPDYHWSIGKLAKDFYDTKFGDGTFSANKVKELLTSAEASNFNILFIYSLNLSSRASEATRDLLPRESSNPSKDSSPTMGIRNDSVGYCIALETNNILHYSYPFYDLQKSPKDMGMGMMTRAVQSAKASGKQYIYLGSAQRPNDTYKFQFDGIEWFDGESWQTDFEKLKNILQKV